MKILIVRTFPNILDPNQYNMQEIGLAKALTRLGHTCGIALYYGKNKDTIETVPVNNEGKIENITVYRLHGYNILKNGFFPSLKRIASQYDVIQVHEYDQITSWLYYAWSKKNVVIYHGPYYHPFNKGYNFKCKIFDYTFLKIRNNYNVPCMTKSNEAGEFLKRKGFVNVTPVGVGLDTEAFENKLRMKVDNNQKILVDSNKFTWIYIGKLEERRNIFFLLDVMESLSFKHPEMEFIIVGNGEEEYKEKCLKKAKNLLENGMLKYYSSASQQELAELYKKANAMLFPSFYDIFGMVLLEAMYFKLPVISSSNGGADMLINDGVNGIVIKEFNISTWVNVAEQLAGKEEYYNCIRSQIAKNNLDIISWQSIALKMERVYQKKEKI